MYRTRTRKIFTDVRARLSRTILASLSIGIGVFGVVLLVGAGDIMFTELEDSMPAEEISMVKIYPGLPAGTLSLAENQAILDEIRALPDVTSAEGQAFYETGWRNADADADDDYNDATLMAFSEGWEDTQLEPIAEVFEGSYPEAGEVAVEIRFANENDVEVGDTIAFRPLDITDDPIEMRVSGIVYHPFFAITGATDALHNERIFANYEDAERIVGFSGLSSITVRYTSYAAALEHEAELFQFIAAETPYVPFFGWTEDPDDIFIAGAVSDVINVLNVLAIVSMVVSGFLVVNVVNTLIVEQKQQIGVMKSIGATPLDIFFVYAGIALLYGIIGTIIGVAVGVPAASMMANAIAPDAQTYVEGFNISLLGIGAGIALGIVVPVIAALVPVLLGTRVTILDAMTDLGIASNWGKGRLAKVINGLPAPIAVRQAFSNIAQKQARLLLTGLTLTIAIASFMAITAIVTIVNDQIDSFFSDLSYDIVLEPRESQDFASFAALLESNYDRVEAVFPRYSVEVGLEGFEATDGLSEGSNRIQLIGIQPDSGVIEFDYTDGDGWTDDPTRDGVVLTGAVAEQLDKGAGDTVTFDFNNTFVELEVIGVRDSSAEVVNFRWDQLATLAGHVDDTGAPLPGSFYVGLADSDPSLEEIDDAIAELDAILLANGIPAEFENRLQVAEDSAAGVNVFALVFGIMSGVMAAVGAVGLLAVLSMAVLERQKEIGVLRSIGAGSLSIVSQFLTEGVLIGIVAWLVAIPVSVFLGEYLFGQLPFQGISYEYPWLVVPFAGLVGVLVVSILASIWPSTSAARKTVSEILRYQ